MIKTRIASTAALFTFGLAAIGGTVLTVAAPANAAPKASDTTSSSDKSNKVEPSLHELFPVQPQPHSDHFGQGHKGLNEVVAPVKGIHDMFPSASAPTKDEIGPSTTNNKFRPGKHELFPVQKGDV
jgi:hypothetical protein